MSARVDPFVITLLSDDLLKSVFKEVVVKRRVLFKDLRQSLREKPQLRVVLDEPKLKAAVEKLKDADLIKERTAPIDDFSTYYVTANGLTAERQLHLIV